MDLDNFKNYSNIKENFMTNGMILGLDIGVS